ncbi:MAG: DUF4012 domain-containing protein [Candidatus Uhrbacteria bacterium]|nr:DUF4012 domain-containing protein [Candidatus Uhrbacteria bacterium]
MSKRIRPVLNTLKPEDIASPMFDDALPERLAAVGADTATHHLLLKQGTGVVSPYVVKLRDEPVDMGDVSPEIAALAHSLIIDGDDESAATVADRDGADELFVELPDLLEQLREFDTAVPNIIVKSPRLASRAATPLAPRMSLDEALASLDGSSFDFVSKSPSNSLAERGRDASEAAPLRSTEGSGEGQIAVSQPVLTETTVVSVDATTLPVVVKVIRHSWFFHPTVRAFGAFLGLSFALVLPLQAMNTISGTTQSADTLTAIGRSALDDLARGAASLREQRYDLAKDDFGQAAAKFTAAEETLGALHASVVAVVNVIPETDRTYSSVRGLISAGLELSQTAEIMSDAATDIAGEESLDLVTKLELLSSYVENALPHVDTAVASLKNVDPSVIPADYATQVAELKAQAPAVAGSMREFLLLVHTFATMLGGDEEMRYLAAFQNSTEIRPTGGFVGSFAQIDLADGAVVSMRVPGGGSYDVQGQLKAFVKAPEPLSLINPRWEFQDANWFPDFPSSAKKMQWFYERSGGPSTDGVIAVNASFVVQLLGVLGPIAMPEYGRTIDAENFMFEAQKIVELEYDKTENAPKAFIGDLAPLLLERITDADVPTLLSIMQLVEKGLREREIQVYFGDNELQSTMHRLGWSGEVKRTDGDYLMVVDTNVGGGKTDGVMEEKIDVHVDVAADGSIVNNVTIARTHNGLSSALFSGKNNVDYLRLYVPQGSEFLSADGFTPPSAELFDPSDIALEADEDLAFYMSDKTVDVKTGVDIWNEFDKTVFGQWVQTMPGETSTIHFSYRLPLGLFQETNTGLLSTARQELGLDRNDSYSIFIQKQSGVVSRTTHVSVSLPTGMTSAWTTFEAGEGGDSVSIDNATDGYFGWLIARDR